MVPIFISNALISEGFNNSPAFRQQNNGEVIFNVGHRIADPQAPNGSRWINFEITVPPSLAPAINQMGIQPKTWINILATVDMRLITDKNGQQKGHRVYIARFLEPVPQSLQKQPHSQPTQTYNGQPQNYGNTQPQPANISSQRQQPMIGFAGASEFNTAMY